MVQLTHDAQSLARYPLLEIRGEAGKVDGIHPPSTLMHSLLLAPLSIICVLAEATLNRQTLISRYNPSRNDSSINYTTPMQVGNGNFAFGMQVLSHHDKLQLTDVQEPISLGCKLSNRGPS